MLAGAGMLAGCHDDEGNYTYTDLDEVAITNSGFVGSGDADVYTVSRGENLTISPEVFFNGRQVTKDSDAPLSYLWTFYSSTSGMGVDYTVDTLATTIDLDAVINRTAGTYFAQLTVTNEKTGIESYFRATCNVEEAISAGWMVLYERADKPGYSDVGLVVNPFNKKNIQKNKEFWNLYSASNGEPLPGEPVSIMHETLPMQSGSPRIATDKTIAVVQTSDFTRDFGYEDMFFDVPAVGKIQWFGSSSKAGCCEVLLMDNKLRILVGTMGSASGNFGLPKRSAEDLGELAPWVSSRCNGNAVLESVVYSQDKGAFYYTNASLDFHEFGAQTGVFDVNDTGGYKFLFNDWGAGLCDFFLFAKGDSRVIAEANFAQTAALPNLGRTWADVSDAPDIRNATTFAVNFIGRYAYYGASDKVYNIAYDNGRSSVAWTAPDPNEKVVCVRTHKYYFNSIFMAMMPNINNVIHIATWNESTGQGKLYEYRINPASGEIFADDESYEYVVPGKVKDMAWKYEFAM